MSNTFNLVNYTTHIQKLMAAGNIEDVAVALQHFITNLTIMHEHYPGCHELNYHELGQQWNRLLSRDKVAQKRETLERLRKYPRGGRS